MSGTFLLALGETFKTVRDEPRPFRMARTYVPSFGRLKAGRGGAALAVGGWPGEPARARGENAGGAALASASAACAAAAGRQLTVPGAEAARAK
jgi:hypothetical protein